MSTSHPTPLLPFTRREYLVLRAVGAGASFSLAREAVSSVAIEHPEWDLAETRTLEEWDEQRTPTTQEGSPVRRRPVSAAPHIFKA